MLVNAWLGVENLFKFGGDGPLIYKPNKPDIKGLWFYELMVLLEKGLPFCCGIRMHSKEKRDGPIPMLSIVTEWLEAIEPKLPTVHETCLVIDSHYTGEEVRQRLLSSPVKFLTASSSGKLTGLYDLCPMDLIGKTTYIAYCNKPTGKIYDLVNEQCILC